MIRLSDSILNLIVHYTDQLDPTGKTVDSMALALKDTTLEPRVMKAWLNAKQKIIQELREKEAIIERIKHLFHRKYFNWMQESSPSKLKRYSPKEQLRNHKHYWTNLTVADRQFHYEASAYIYNDVNKYFSKPLETVTLAKLKKAYLQLCKITWFPLVIKNTIFEADLLKSNAKLDVEPLVVKYQNHTKCIPVQHIAFIFAKMAAASGYQFFAGLTYQQKYTVAMIAARNGHYLPSQEFTDEDEFALQLTNTKNDRLYTKTYVTDVLMYRKTFHKPQEMIPKLEASVEQKIQWVNFFVDRGHTYTLLTLTSNKFSSENIYSVAQRAAALNFPNQTNPWFITDLNMKGEEALNLAKIQAKINIERLVKNISHYNLSAPQKNQLAEYIFIAEKMDLRYLPPFNIDLNQTYKILDARREEITPELWVQLCNIPFKLELDGNPLHSVMHFSALHGRDDFFDAPEWIQELDRKVNWKNLPYDNISFILDYVSLLPSNINPIEYLKYQYEMKKNDPQFKDNKPWNALIKLVSCRMNAEDVKSNIMVIEKTYDRFRIARILAKRGMKIKSPADYPIDISAHIQDFDLNTLQKEHVAADAVKYGGVAVAGLLHNYELTPERNGELAVNLARRHGLEALRSLGNLPIPASALEQINSMFIKKHEIETPDENISQMQKRQKMTLPEVPAQFLNNNAGSSREKAMQFVNLLKSIRGDSNTI